MRVSLSYLERPVTEDERGVAKFLEKLISAIRGRDFDTLSDLYIFRLSTGEYTKPEKNKFIENIRNFSPRTKELCFEDIIIRTVTKETAKVFFVRYLEILGNLLPQTSQRVMYLCKRAGLWYILYNPPEDSN
ncbi:MAG: hypothetical protein UW76_C0015G0005 [Parcubacteria group bacterium GW2011_GWF2_44_8b]|nr:MAG: hypothetical protein UV94_C0006G0057 [Parcubacteria group bacterium GW2011_GWC1_43_30]KKT80522.1 MAG: hypothetical protein UW76_C0015G0005 [Parcubacteria group bacterium GW2011_GWF2_44_8b]KKT86005.1 MAG: hypothetical protein UW83_C0004G0012 [Parcubacteria group bacterium GW2011_GWD1_44_9]